MADPRNQVRSKTIFEQTEITPMAAVEDYWTAERMANAMPIAIEIDVSDAPNFSNTWSNANNELALDSTFADGVEAQTLEQPMAGALPADTSRVLNANMHPFSCIGKMFMTFDNQNYVGSAWVIGERAVFTAAHCLYDQANGGWADRIKFVPQFDNFAEPAGSWIGTKLHALDGWLTSRDFNQDMAIFEVDRPIGPITGAIGWIANQAPNQGPYTAIGYPSSPPFSGRNMWQSVGAYINGGHTIQMHNDMTQGCSGGPWLINKDGRIYANGLNSHKRANPGTMYSPYFGEGFVNLLDEVGILPA